MINKSIPRRLASSIKGLERMINYINKTRSTKELSILEIGSWVGVSTELFAKNFKYVVACDPWDATTGINTKYDMRQVEKEFDERIKKYNNIFKIKTTSENFNKNIDNYNKTINDLFKDKIYEFFGEEVNLTGYDVIYIDGAHDFINVMKDIILWKDRCNLFLCGHDFCDKFPGVKKAVKSLLGQPEKIFSDSSWLFKTKKED